MKGWDGGQTGRGGGDEFPVSVKRGGGLGTASAGRGLQVSRDAVHGSRLGIWCVATWACPMGLCGSEHRTRRAAGAKCGAGNAPVPSHPGGGTPDPGSPLTAPTALLQHEGRRGGRDVFCEHHHQGPRSHYNSNTQAAGRERRERAGASPAAWPGRGGGVVPGVPAAPMVPAVRGLGFPTRSSPFLWSRLFPGSPMRAGAALPPAEPRGGVRSCGAHP